MKNDAYVQKQDTFLLSYPRSGNTWLRRMLTDLCFQLMGEDTGVPGFYSSENIFAVSPTFEKHDLADCPRPAHVFFLIKAHDASVAERFRFVYIYRQPEDVLVSYFRFLKKEPIAYMESGLETFCKQRLKDWNQHVETAIAHAPQGLFVAYEDMVNQTAVHLQRVCDFVGIAATPEQIETAVAHCTVQNQRKQMRKVLSDYMIATAKVGGNLEFLSAELTADIRAGSAHNLERLRGLSSAK